MRARVAQRLEHCDWQRSCVQGEPAVGDGRAPYQQMFRSGLAPSAQRATRADNSEARGRGGNKSQAILTKRITRFRGRAHQHDVVPRCIEWYDRASLALARAREPAIPEGAHAALWCEQETTAGELDAHLEAWWSLLEDTGAMVDETLFAQDDAGRARLAKMRHAVPAGINERVVANGMPKVGTDCSVPAAALPEMMKAYEAVPLPHVLFGHIGDSHLHLNMLPTNSTELEKARQIYRHLCQEAVRLGGSVSAEHGIGKLKRAHLADMVGTEVISEFRALKSYLDPNWILGRGNLFQRTDS